MSTPITRAKREPFILVAFCLAVVLEVLPVEQGVMLPLFAQDRLTEAALVKAAVLVLILVPLTIGGRRLFRNAGAYRGLGLAITTLCIVLINLIITLLAFSRAG